MTAALRTMRSRTATAVGLLVVLLALLPAATAGAHTGLDSSDPADGEVVAEPVDEVLLTFTAPVTLIEGGFVALNGDGVLQEPSEVLTDDDTTFRLRFDPPLAGGAIGVRWSIRAADGHVKEGAFSFVVEAASAVPTTAPVTVSPTPSTDPQTSTSPSTPPTLPPATEPTTDAAISPSAPPSSTAPSGGTEVPTSVAADEAAGSAQSPESLEAFLAVDGSRPGDTTATVGRVISFIGIALAIGAIAFAATSLRGTREEVGAVIGGARLAGVAIVVGATTEYFGVSRILDESLAGTWSTQPGFATVLRFVGGLAIAVGLASAFAARSTAPRPLSAAVIERHDAPTTALSADGRWAVDARSWLAGVGVAALVASFWFDGHTVTEGIRPVHAAVNTVHVLAGSIWVGGVVALVALMWGRSRRDQPLRAGELIVRFSHVATIALVAVLVAGALMAVTVLDSPGDLTSTEWGQTLLLKSGAVAIAALIGAYNHFRLRPALESDPESPALAERLRSSMTAEAIMLVFVVVVTAWLVVAAT